MRRIDWPFVAAFALVAMTVVGCLGLLAITIMWMLS